MSIKNMDKNPSDIKKISVISTIAAAFLTRSSAAMFFAVLLSCISSFYGVTNYGKTLDLLAAALIIIGGRTAQFLRLRRHGLSFKVIKNNRKSLDPRLSGNLGDISGIGSTAGAVVGTLMVLSRLFIINGGTFSSGSPAQVLPHVIAEGICMGVMISMFTSPASVDCSLYVVGGRTFGVSGDELVKCISRSSHNEKMMKNLSRMLYIRVIAVTCLSVALVTMAICGAGAVYSCWQLGFFEIMTVLLSECCTRAKENRFTDEKYPIYGGSAKRKSKVHILLFLLISFGFLFSFPFRSVYTEYTPVHDFDYYSEEDYSESIEIFSIPYHVEENKALYNGYFLFTALLIAAASGSFALSDGFFSLKQISTELWAAAASFSSAALLGVTKSGYMLDFNQYLVVVSLLCLVIIVSMIDYFAEKQSEGKSKKDKKQKAPAKK